MTTPKTKDSKARSIRNKLNYRDVLRWNGWVSVVFWQESLRVSSKWDLDPQKEWIGIPATIKSKSTKEIIIDWPNPEIAISELELLY